jgi:hypothetical protein
MRLMRVRVGRLEGAVLLVGRFRSGRSGVAGSYLVVSDNCWGRGVRLTQLSAKAMVRA